MRECLEAASRGQGYAGAQAGLLELPHTEDGDATQQLQERLRQQSQAEMQAQVRGLTAVRIQGLGFRVCNGVAGVGFNG